MLDFEDTFVAANADYFILFYLQSKERLAHEQLLVGKLGLNLVDLSSKLSQSISTRVEEMTAAEANVNEWNEELDVVSEINF
jgi:hypothetical protein